MLIVLLMIVLASPGRLPEYGPISLFELTLQADLIVDASVLETDPQGVAANVLVQPVRLGVHEVIVGNGPLKELQMVGVAGSLCAERYAPYEAGQRSVFFLRWERTAEGRQLRQRPLRLLGQGADGECPVVEGSVLHVPFGWECKDCATYSAFGYEYTGHASPLRSFVEAVKGIRECFDWSAETKGGSRVWKIEKLEMKCVRTRLVSLEGSNPVFGQILGGVFSKKLLGRINSLKSH